MSTCFVAPCWPITIFKLACIARPRRTCTAAPRGTCVTRTPGLLAPGGAVCGPLRRLARNTMRLARWQWRRNHRHHLHRVHRLHRLHECDHAAPFRALRLRRGRKMIQQRSSRMHPARPRHTRHAPQRSAALRPVPHQRPAARRGNGKRFRCWSSQTRSSVRSAWRWSTPPRHHPATR